MNIFCKYGTFVHELATMAQEVECRLGKAEVTGSIPVSSFFLCPKTDNFLFKYRFCGFQKLQIYDKIKHQDDI